MQYVLSVLVVLSLSCTVAVAQMQLGQSARTVNTMIEAPDATWMLSEGGHPTNVSIDRRTAVVEHFEIQEQGHPDHSIEAG